MGELDYIALQQRYGGRYVADCDGEVIASAETYEELSEQLEGMDVDWDRTVIGFVERSDVIRV